MATNIIHALARGLPLDVPASSGIPAVQGRAEREIALWKGVSEQSTEALPHLRRYWETVGLRDSEWSPTGTPWSAAFISEIMKPYGLPPSSAHFQYATAVKEGKASGWTAYALDGRPVQLAPGDILVKPRGSGKPSEDPYWWSHGDLIYSVGETAEWVGGNVGDTVQTGSFPIGPSGADVDGAYVLLLRPAQKKSVGPLLLIAGAFVAFVAFRK